MFFRIETDRTEWPVALRGLFSGPQVTTCWLIGGGPSLASLPTKAMDQSPLPKFAVNLAGHRLLRPTFWTSYDPTVRFHRSTYLDASILKFVHPCRAMDLVPETTFKVCECPGVLFFQRDKMRGFFNFLAGRTSATTTEGDSSGAISDWQDSLIQAIEIAFHLGFRRLLLAGCDMYVRPPEKLRVLAAKRSVEYQERELLSEFVSRCEKSGWDRQDIENSIQVHPYHFEETKSLRASIQTDGHYFRISQYLRLCRRNLTESGLELVSVTPGSRLNDYFPYRDCHEALRYEVDQIGDPHHETTDGRYSSTESRHPPCLGPMRDFRPHHWSASGRPEPEPAEEIREFEKGDPSLPKCVPSLREVPIEINEIG